ncbi:MAG TPA: phosphoglycerate dehydrogenase [Gammaproteobacteria bacterium]|nr:phosphoglycerate dehydrogenase [Gammaproteobacteria bacterium]
MKVFIADDIAREGVDYLRKHTDYLIDFSPKLEEADACVHIRDADAVIVRSATSIRGKILESAGLLKVIGRAGIGTDNIDITTATERGIVVLNTPDANATTTAELAIAHILSLCRHLPAADRSVRNGEWQRSRFIGTEVSDKVLGIIGFGTIGRIVASRAIGLRMKVLGYDPFVTGEVFAEANVEPVSLETLLAAADIVTLHCPLVEKTRHLINRETLQQMKHGARLVNCARGDLVDESALYDALQDGRLSGAALDVYAQEPPLNSPLLKLENVVFTPHLGASTEEAQTAVGIEIARQVATFLQQGEAINAINLPRISGREAERLKPYQLLANKMGQLLASMCPAAITQLQVALLGQVAELNSHTIVTEAIIGLLSEHFSTPVNQVNAHHLARRQGIAVAESRSSESRDYLTLISLTASFDSQDITLAGTLFDERHPRLVRINDYYLEAPLQGNLLITRHIDKPGVIGDIGALLATEQINIATMQVGNNDQSDMAIAIIGISHLLDESTLDKVRNLAAIDKAIQISL